MFALTVHVHEIFPSTLFLLILKVFYFGIFNAFFYFLYSFMKMKAYTVCARAQASILWSSGHSVKNKLPNCWRSLNDDRTNGQK